ncbi:MAG TPA: aminodeoxychorismate/anthranilate synthase component II [Pyrinomonadaceae bacterium]|jgi:anthranilate synthase component 2|nr:aminodeoxychorismate/anthranilate synthase component II [Pyrinomonadaceae bacterium]
MKVLLLDNYDSFTFNLYQLVGEVSGIRPDVFRNDKISLDEVEKYDKILLSPGPGLPSEAGTMPELVKRFAGQKSILGVCLGHQCIAENFGAKLENMERVCHGFGMETRVEVEDELLFRGVPKQFESGRYHSWMVSKEGLPESLEVTALDADGRVMALRHREYDLRGVQFHPESVLTPDGAAILRNWLQDKTGDKR